MKYCHCVVIKMWCNYANLRMMLLSFASFWWWWQVFVACRSLACLLPPFSGEKSFSLIIINYFSSLIHSSISFMFSFWVKIFIRQFLQRRFKTSFEDVKKSENYFFSFPHKVFFTAAQHNYMQKVSSNKSGKTNHLRVLKVLYVCFHCFLWS